MLFQQNYSLVLTPKGVRSEEQGARSLFWAFSNLKHAIAMPILLFYSLKFLCRWAQGLFRR
jgi:hypothetical protein